MVRAKGPVWGWVCFKFLLEVNESFRKFSGDPWDLCISEAKNVTPKKQTMVT